MKTQRLNEWVRSTIFKVERINKIRNIGEFSSLNAKGIVQSFFGARLGNAAIKKVSNVSVLTGRP